MTRLFLLAAMSVALRAADTYTITGTVVDHLQNRPLNYILMTLTSNQDRRMTVSMVTGSDGRFGFTNLTAGKYSLSAQRRGTNQPQLYQQDDQFSTAIAVGPAAPAPDVVFLLEALASISGSVLDQSGEPVRNAQIWLFRKAVRGGRPNMQQMGARSTDAAGAFHAGHLQPGTYFIAVSGRPWYAQPFPQLSGQPNPSQELDVVYPITYYGDTTDPAAAASINLNEAGSANVQINMRPVPAVHLDLGPSQNAPPNSNPLRRPGPHPNLMAETLGGHMIPVMSNVMGVNGRDELAGIAPGRYIVRAMNFDGERAQPGPSARIDVTGNTAINLDNLKATSLIGQLTYEGIERPANESMLQFACGNDGFAGRVAKDGSFTVVGNSIPAGHCTVALVNAPRFHVKSVTTRGGKPSADTFDVVDGVENQITVLAAAGEASQLEGTATRDDKPFSAAMVLLLPEDLTRGALIRRDQSDSDGSFILPNVLPGRYTLIAIDNGKELAFRDPAVIQPYLSDGTAIEVPLHSKTPLKVNVQQRRVN